MCPRLTSRGHIVATTRARTTGLDAHSGEPERKQGRRLLLTRDGEAKLARELIKETLEQRRFSRARRSKEDEGLERFRSRR